MKDKVTSIPSPAWRRPSGPLNVWRIVEGQQKLEDGTTKSIKFSIQEVPEDRYEETLDFMMKYFVVDEPMCKVFNFKDDPDAQSSLRTVWNYCLSQGIVEAAYVLDSNADISELAALNMLCVANDETDADMDLLEEKYKSDKLKNIFTIMGKLSKQADARSILGVDKYIGALGLTVSHKYRGQKLGLRMLEARIDIGKKYGIPASATVFTARGSQILAERAGFQTAMIQNYSNIFDENGKPMFTGIESKDMRLMMRRLY